MLLLVTINFLRSKKLTFWRYVKEQCLSLLEGLFHKIHLITQDNYFIAYPCMCRGMFTLALSQPLPTAPLAIPPLNLSGRVPPRNASVGLDHVEKPAGMTVWAEFHNGAAAGLKISPNLSQVSITNYKISTYHNL